MALIDRVKTRTGSDLPDGELQDMIDAISVELDTRFGAAGPITVELGDLSDPDSRFRRTLRVARPIDLNAPMTIVESDPGNSGGDGETVLAPGDYRIRHEGRTLQRLALGPNGREYWAPLVALTYTPAGEQPARDEVTIKLVQIDMSYRGLLKSERAGDYQWQGSVSSDSYAAEREGILKSLADRRGMVMA